MRTLSRVNLILLLLVALLGGAAWWLQSSDMPPPLTRLSPARIQQIRLIRAGQTIELQRHNGVWWLGEARADRQRVAQLLGIATTPSLAHFPLPQGRLAAFGLQPPETILWLDQTELRFGTTEPLSGQRYLQIGDQVHLIGDGFRHHLNAPAAAFLE